MITRFILKNILSRVLPGKIPPYFMFTDVDMAAVPADQYKDLDVLTDGELEELVKTNALGVPMVFPLQLRIAGSD